MRYTLLLTLILMCNVFSQEIVNYNLNSPYQTFIGNENYLQTERIWKKWNGNDWDSYRMWTYEYNENNQETDTYFFTGFFTGVGALTGASDCRY